MKSHRIIYTEKVGNAEVGRSALVNAKDANTAKMNFGKRHKNCRILKVK